jgi:hypothetical protein
MYISHFVCMNVIIHVNAERFTFNKPKIHILAKILLSTSGNLKNGVFLCIH